MGHTQQQRQAFQIARFSRALVANQEEQVHPTKSVLHLELLDWEVFRGVL